MRSPRVRSTFFWSGDALEHGRFGPPGYLTLVRWAGCSAVQVGRHVKC